jgi:uncharacterized NAD(P)/FAD-binding protein YdhS
MRHPSVAIIGAGFSGTMLASHLSRCLDPTIPIDLIERRKDFGPGLAYSTECPDHVLNVPAARMSAFADRPGHFLEWSRHRPGDVPYAADSFVPRRVYGCYLRELLADAIRGRANGGLRRRRGAVVGITREASGLTLRLREGSTIDAGIVVLATGNDAPADPFPFLLGAPFYRPDPWVPDATEGIAANDAVLAIGTGLTMVDTVLQLWRLGHRGPIHALSRHGLVSRAHTEMASPAVDFAPSEIPRPLSDLARFVRLQAERSAAAGRPWQAVVDALRSVTQDIWRGWSDTERHRFLCHARTWWDVHRHRMAPAVAATIEALRASGQLRIHAGRITGFAARGARADIFWRPRGATTTAALRVHRVINCTGPATCVTRSTDPLIRSLLAGGLARADSLGLGFDTTADGALRGPASDALFGVGPVCRGALWENTAVPDIRVQCETMAQHVAAVAWRRMEPAAALWR